MKSSRYPISAGRDIKEPNTGLKFVVLNEDVIGSTVADKENCAAARALCRLSDINHAWVFRTRTLVQRKNGSIERYSNPKRLQTTVENFDSTAGFFPAGEYELRAVTKGQRREAKRERNERNKNRAGGVRPYKYTRPPHVLRMK
jgi:hypothetical protein